MGERLPLDKKKLEKKQTIASKPEGKTEKVPPAHFIPDGQSKSIDAPASFITLILASAFSIKLEKRNSVSSSRVNS